MHGLTHGWARGLARDCAHLAPWACVASHAGRAPVPAVVRSIARGCARPRTLSCGMCWSCGHARLCTLFLPAALHALTRYPARSCVCRSRGRACPYTPSCLCVPAHAILPVVLHALNTRSCTPVHAIPPVLVHALARGPADPCPWLCTPSCSWLCTPVRTILPLVLHTCAHHPAPGFAHSHTPPCSWLCTPVHAIPPVVVGALACGCARPCLWSRRP